LILVITDATTVVTTLMQDLSVDVYTCVTVIIVYFSLELRSPYKTLILPTTWFSIQALKARLLYTGFFFKTILTVACIRSKLIRCCISY